MNMRFTEDARKICQLAFAYAVPNTTFVGPPHLLMALLNEGTCIASDILRNEHLDRTTLLEFLSDYNLKAQSKVEEHTDPSEPTIDQNLINIVRLAWSGLGLNQRHCGMTTFQPSICF
jgi:ATP-dependent Clp protease ATP-binding subunit ClpA